MSDPAIQVANLNLHLGGKHILRDVSLTVESGHYVSIIGPNGAGKTSLIRCINRLARTKSGDVSILGNPLQSYTQRDLAKIVSYVPQADARYFPFSVYEFVLMGRYPHLSPFTSVGESDRKVVDEALDRTSMSDFADRSLHTLSGGERQSVFIAAALTQGAQILLLDEPTSFLDYKHQVDVLALLKGLNKEEGITIVAVTHNVNNAVLSSDKVVALKDGAIAFDGTPDALIDNGALEKIYDTPFELVAHGDAAQPIVIPKERSE